MSLILGLVNQEYILFFCLEQAPIICFDQIVDVKVMIAIIITASEFFFWSPETDNWNIAVLSKALRKLNTDIWVLGIYFALDGVCIFCLLRSKLDSRDRVSKFHLSCIYFVLFPTSICVYVLYICKHSIRYHQFLWFQSLFLHFIHWMREVCKSRI